MSNRRSMALALTLTAAVAFAAPCRAETFRYAFQSDVLSMDPYAIAENFSTAFLHNIYEPLVRYNAKMELEPALATSWEMINPTTWRFGLREGVKFHNGDPFAADDVLFSLKRAQSKGSDMEFYVGSIAEIKKVDSHTVDVITKTPNPILGNFIATWYMMDQEWAQANGAVEPVDLQSNRENYATLHANGT